MQHPEEYSICISDITGRKIMSIEKFRNEIVVDRSVIPAGAYFYDIIKKDRTVVKKGKLLFR
jgi:hypothetical protein